MAKRDNTTNRASWTGLALLAAMLFYVSGAALLVHLQLDHADGLSTSIQAACEDAHGIPHHNTPADAPTSPTKNKCPLCDMLTASTHTAAIVAPAQTIFFADTSVLALVPGESPAVRLSTTGISRRGPPSLG